MFISVVKEGRMCTYCPYTLRQTGLHVNLRLGIFCTTNAQVTLPLAFLQTLKLCSSSEVLVRDQLKIIFSNIYVNMSHNLKKPRM